MSTTDDERELVMLCQRVGSQVPHWTQGAGGNVSVKTKDHRLIIKASGLRLDAIRIGSGYVFVDQKLFDDQWANVNDEDHYARLIRDAQIQIPGSTLKPSMECGLHAVLPKKYVLHFHSLVALLMAHEWRKHPEEIDSRICFVEESMPGLRLSQIINEKNKQSQADIWVLENHGVILQTDSSPDQILEEWTRLENEFLNNFGYPEISQGQWVPASPPSAKIYFPDSAVFESALESAINEFNQRAWTEKEALRVDLFGTNKNAAEIAWATVLLQNLQPQLRELSPKIRHSVGSLPTEAIRKGTS